MREGGSVRVRPGPRPRAGLAPSARPPCCLRPAPSHRPPPSHFVFVFLQGGALPAGVETMVLTLGESWPVLVGKRFLSLSAADGSDGSHDSWDVERVAEWPWLSGTIRAVSHTDVNKKDLKVQSALGLCRRTFRSYLGNATMGSLPPFSENEDQKVGI